MRTGRWSCGAAAGVAVCGAAVSATRGANGDALIKPPGDYLEKVRGADGNVSGLRPSDQPSDKKFFGLF